MNKPHKWAEVIKAWADGKTVEYNGSGIWRVMTNPQFTGAGEYRIKSEPEIANYCSVHSVPGPSGKFRMIKIRTTYIDGVPITVCLCGE